MQHLKLPKGFGSIIKLTGKRRCPYMARPAQTKYDENGKPIYPKAIGYYKTYPEAMEALLEFNRNPYDVDKAHITFGEVFEKTMLEKTTGEKRISLCTERSYRSIYSQNLSQLSNEPIIKLKVGDFQKIIDESELSNGSRRLMIAVIKQIYKYAMKFEIVNKDQSTYLETNKVDDREPGEPFTEEEMEILKQHADDENVRMILTMIYTGYRAGAFRKMEYNKDEQYFKGGLKTAAGKGRIVPLHPSIQEFAPDIVGMEYQSIRYRFAIALKKLGIKKHTPHDARHTFSYLCDKYGIDPLTKRILLGHALGSDVTDLRYGHRSFDQLKEAVESIAY